jgi:predicted nuclease of predicted toxin-antitoxin system
MKILFDQGTPVPLRRYLTEHEVATAAEMDWSQLTNGELLAAATEAGFELLVTTDQNLRYQQNLKSRKIAVVVLMSASWPRISKQTVNVAEAINVLGTSDYIEVEI